MEPKPSITADSYLLESEALFETLAELKREQVKVEDRMGAMLCANQYLQAAFPKDADRLEAAYARMAKHMDWE